MAKTLIELKRWLNGVIADDSTLIGVYAPSTLVVYTSAAPGPRFYGSFDTGVAPALPPVADEELADEPEVTSAKVEEKPHSKAEKK